TLNENPENGEVTYTYYISGGRRPVMTGTANGAETEGGVPKYAGTYYIGATITETEHYTASTISPTKQFTIAPREVSTPVFEGLQETYLYDNGNEIKPAFTLKDDLGNVIPESEYTVTYSDNTDAGEATITITDNADGNYNVSGTAKFTIITHQHDWVYTANGNVITATCSNSDGGCTDTNGGTLTISAPADLYADGITAKEATVENNLVDTSVAVSDITYSSGSAPKTAGTYTASVTAGGATASIKFTLLNYAAKVTDEDGNLIGNYKTLADAVTAASASEESTLTLLDDITVAQEQYIESGKFTLDLNGKNLVSESCRVIESYAVLTIKDSGEGGTIYGKGGGGYAIINRGTLTFKSGTVKGDGGIENQGTLTFNNGTVESGIYGAISNFNMAYVYDGVLRSSGSAAFNNYSTAYVYGGEISGVLNEGTAYISGGKIFRNNYAAFNLHAGTVEITGGSFSGTDWDDGYYSGTPYGEWTVCYTEGVNLILKGGEFPNGFVVNEITANEFLADGYHFRNEQGKVVDGSSRIIKEKVTVEKGADFSADAVVNVDNVVYNGAAQEPTVTVKVGGKTITEGKDYTLAFANNINAGMATVTVTGAGDYEGEIVKTFEIAKADSSVDVYPEANELTYNGEAQSLVTAGSSESGTVVYSLDGAEYSVSVPTGTNAGEYTVYYKVEGDSNHNDTEPETLTVTIGKKSVTAIATVPDRIYGDDYRVDTSKVVVTFDGVVDGDDVGYVVIDAYYHVHTVTDNAPVQVVYNVNGADAGNYQFPEYGDWMAPDYGVQATGKVLPRDIADAQIVLGDTLIYNGAEQTQSIASVTVIGKDVTYTVSGNTATNVGVYELTITGNGNFSGTKTALFEVAPDTSAIDDLTVDNVKSSDKEAIEAVAKQIENAVTDLADDEKKAEYKAIADKCNALLQKIDDVQAEIERINEEVNAYDVETVKSSDILNLGKLLADIAALTNGDNITEDERAALEDNYVTINELIEKLSEVAEEIARVDEEVKSYDESTIKSSDSEDLEQLKADIQALIDSTNVTESEQIALGEMIADIDALEEKIAETEEKFEEIKNIENNLNPETVTSDDKATIEETLAEIEAVNPDNLTDEQKAEYAEIKAGFEALLEEIETANAQVDEIGAELEMFDEERVTIFSKDEIEALKAKIEELLADTNMGEAEKAKLNEYKAQAEKLIEIINAPAEYFAMRIFYFIWDALHWLSSHVVFIFNWIFAMF
ncbi:MAG: hypothetical protein IKU08_10740, partial [Clostridia bacterium]|nr:hypothetical protein [Clostridia bacterium]